MMIALQARKLANYIQSLDTFPDVVIDRDNNYDHIGALFTDIVLQAGLNYRSVVRPRVETLLFSFPEATTLKQFEELINTIGLEKLIRWQHPEKIRRMHDLLDFAKRNHIDSCADFRVFLKTQNSRSKMLKLNGFGPKTVDYTLKLLNFDTVAVDRHIYSFVAMADITIKNYEATKQIVEFAADFLNVSRSAMDYSIWLYMSKKGINEER